MLQFKGSLPVEPAYLPEGYDFAPVRKLRTKEVHPKYRIFTGITGFSLVIGIRIIVFVAGAEAKQFIPLQNAP